MSATPLRFIHVRNKLDNVPCNNGGFTFAYFKDESSIVHFSVSKCSRRDQYSRVIGRAVTKGRLESGNLMTFPAQEGDNSPGLASQVLFEASKLGIIPPQ